MGAGAAEERDSQSGKLDGDLGGSAARRSGERTDRFRETEAALALTWLASRGIRTPLRLLAQDRPASRVWGANAEELRAMGFNERGIRTLLGVRRSVPHRELADCLRRERLAFLPFGCPAYPEELRHLELPPAGLFLAGDGARLALALSRPRITIVGTRNASSYGLAAAETLARAFAQAEVTVVSGLALGIDAQAHLSALEAGGTTIAVLGSGPEVAYPRRHRCLYERVAGSGGVLSEVPPGTPVTPWAFPWRNRLLAALGDAVLVVQAGERSGALITADRALDLGREVFAVPGPIAGQSHRGSNRLLYEGAHLALDPSHTVQDFFRQTRKAMGARTPPEPDTGPERMPSLGEGWGRIEGLLHLALGRGPASLEELASATGCTISEVSAACALLELKGLAARAGPGRYTLMP